MLLKFQLFKGMVPRLPSPSLPKDVAAFALNAELSYADLRGVHQGRVVQSSLTVAGKAPRTLYTEDGVDYFAWSNDVDVTKSLVIGDVYSRIYYTIMYDDGPLAKVARLFRNPSGVLEGGGQTKVIGTSLVGGNFQPPENSSNPDSWILGVPAPTVAGDGNENANLVVTLVDKPAWPGIPKLAMRVTFFWEDSSGRIVKPIDVSNNEVAPSTVNVFYSSVESSRGNKIQDMLWPLGGAGRSFGPRPYKYYWFDPPKTADYALSRTVVVTNAGPNLMTVLYNGTSLPPIEGGGGSEGGGTYTQQ